MLSAQQRGWESFGIRRGYDGLLGDTREAGSGLIPLGPILDPPATAGEEHSRPSRTLISFWVTTIQGFSWADA